MRDRRLIGAGIAVAMLAFHTQAAEAEDAAAAAAVPDADAASEGEVIVLGRGGARQVQTVAGEELKLEAPGASPLKLVDKLPNVNFQHADAFGSYEWSARITIRGFNQSQLGFTLDDVPLGDMTYGNHNGLHISRAIISENVGQVELAQGAGALETASDSNLGGTLKYSSRRPSDTFGLYVAGTAGSWDMLRGFARLDTGLLPSGGRGYISIADQTADKWKGHGPQRTLQGNIKFEQPIGKAIVTAWLNGSKRRETDYQDMSLEMIHRLGAKWDNISNDWQLAVRLAEIGANRGDNSSPKAHPEVGTVYPSPIVSLDDTYYNSTGVRNDLIGALTIDLPVNDILTLHATGYGHHDRGIGTWGTPYQASPNYGVAGATTDNAPISLRATNYHLSRGGVVANALFKLDNHQISAGLWYEGNQFEQSRDFYGLNLDSPGRNFLAFQSNPFLTQWDYDFHTTTWNFYAQDTWHATDHLTVNFGAKSLSVENKAKTIAALPGNVKNGTIKAKKNFLPQAGFKLDVANNAEIFGDYAKNMRAFASSGTAGPFSASEAGFNAIKDSLKPETADTFELGWRYHRSGFQGTAALYHVKFHNRLFTVEQGPGILGNPSALSNVGGVTATGFEAAGSWTFAHNWSLFGSYAYNHSKYDEDTHDGAGKVIAHTDGKNTVDTPKHLLKGELGYDDGGVFARVGGSYLSKRFFSYENDQSVPSQFLAELTAGYRFTQSGPLKGLEIQANVTNLFNKKFISTIDSNGFPVRGDSQTLLPGAPREGFISIRKQF